MEMKPILEHCGFILKGMTMEKVKTRRPETLYCTTRNFKFCVVDCLLKVF